MQDDLYLGLMSGTSMDGIDAAIVSFNNNRCNVIGATAFGYEASLKSRLQSIKTSSENINLDEFGMLNRDVGMAFGEAALKLIRSCKLAPERIRAIGSHGQTLRHRTDVRAPFSLQIGDPNTIAALTDITTVADFRGRDIALGGEGAPLTPAFHDWLLQDRDSAIAVVNLGGIANVSLLTADGGLVGFDTGPANTLIDAWIFEANGKSYDADGALARQGNVNQTLLRELIKDPYFARRAPKSTGFEYFNLNWVRERVGNTPLTRNLEDMLATLTELSATTVAAALSNCDDGLTAIYLCGGGANNPYLAERIANAIAPLPVTTTADIGLDPDWVEACAFAWLAKMTLENRSGNRPAVTGSSKPAVLGAIYPGHYGRWSFTD